MLLMLCSFGLFTYCLNHFIQLPNKLGVFTIAGNNVWVTQSNIKVFWTQDNYLFEEHIRNSDPNHCFGPHSEQELTNILAQIYLTFSKIQTEQNKIFMNKTCFNYSGVFLGENSNYYIAIEASGFQLPCFHQRQRQVHYISWNQALDLCESHEGSLPILKSRQELYEFIALLKFSLHKLSHKMMAITPAPDSFEILFIGLTGNAPNEVRNVKWFGAVPYVVLSNL